MTSFLPLESFANDNNAHAHEISCIAFGLLLICINKQNMASHLLCLSVRKL